MPVVQAAQLVYTNVEADRSPTRRRGEQLWCWTPGLPEVALREAQKRLEDFPSRLTPSQVRELRRVTFAHLPGTDLVLLARSTPQTKPDKFGRGGRFHAHALLIPASELGRVGGNPFRVLDAFKFDASPEDTDPKREGPQRDQLPHVPVSCPDEDPPAPAGPAALGVMAQAACDGRPTLGLVWPQDAVLGALRVLFRRLPRGLRERTGFDTLFPGSPATAGSYRFIAHVTPDRLREQGFKDFHLLDPDGTGRPPLPAAGAKWFGPFFAACGDLTDDEVQAAFALGERLTADGRVDEVPAGLTERALVCLRTDPEIGEAERVWAEEATAVVSSAELAREFPDVVAACRDYYATSGLEGLRRRLTPPPADTVAVPILRDLEARREPPAVGLCEAVMRLARGENTEPFKKIRRVLARWTAPPPFDQVREYLRREGDLRRWYWDWARQTLAEPYQNEAGLIDLLLARRELSAEEVRDCWLGSQFLARIDDEPDIVPGEAWPAPDPGGELPVAESVVVYTRADVIDYLVAARLAGDADFPDLAGRPAGVADYLWTHWFPTAGFHRALSYLIDDTDAARPAHSLGVKVGMEKWNHFHFRLLEALAGADQRRLYDELLPFASPDPARDNRIIESRWTAPESVRQTFLDHYRSGDLPGLVHMLQTMGDNCYAWVANTYALPHVDTKGVAERVGNTFWVGRRLHPRKKMLDVEARGTWLVVQALATAVVAPLSPDRVDDPADVVAGKERRFHWLLRRLTRPAETADAPVVES